MAGYEGAIVTITSPKIMWGPGEGKPVYTFAPDVPLMGLEGCIHLAPPDCLEPCDDSAYEEAVGSWDEIAAACGFDPRKAKRADG